ncbi:MAG TPA: ubiquinone-binding protein [Rhodospirillaceae bacterium]|nr:ubiquinone-binding protein [Rhodospirillaceae bacterium]
MPRHLEKKVLPYTPTQLFDLVADVSRYHEFLPWCQQSRVYDQTEAGLRADLLVGYRSVCDTFSSVVRLDRPRSIDVNYVEGPLAHLSNRWQFDPAPNGQCEVTFFVDFRFRSMLLGVMMDAFFDRAFLKMVEAFEARAAALHGPAYAKAG